MTEHKFTDEQIIKALETCTADSGGCDECCCRYLECSDCVNALCADALALIKRQSEDIDRLIEINTHNIVSQNEIKAEAIKEFAERLKERHYFHASCVGNCYQMSGNNIDNLVKEMTRRCPDCKHFVGCEAACGGVPCDGYTEGDTNG